MKPTVHFKDLCLTDSAILYPNQEPSQTESNPQSQSTSTRSRPRARARSPSPSLSYDPIQQDQYSNHPALQYSAPLTQTSARSSQLISSSSGSPVDSDPESEFDSEAEDQSTPPLNPTTDPSSSDPSPSTESPSTFFQRHDLRLPKLIQSRFQTRRVKGSRREKVKMVSTNLQTHFRSWFRETSSDGTPILPHQLSKKYTVSDKVLGQGSFAVVKPVTEKSTGEERALKIIAKKPMKDGNENMLKEEINILGKVRHQNV